MTSIQLDYHPFVKDFRSIAVHADRLQNPAFYNRGSVDQMLFQKRLGKWMGYAWSTVRNFLSEPINPKSRKFTKTLSDAAFEGFCKNVSAIFEKAYRDSSQLDEVEEVILFKTWKVKIEVLFETEKKRESLTKAEDIDDVQNHPASSEQEAKSNEIKLKMLTAMEGHFIVFSGSYLEELDIKKDEKKDSFIISYRKSRPINWLDEKVWIKHINSFFEGKLTFFDYVITSEMSGILRLYFKDKPVPDKKIPLYISINRPSKLEGNIDVLAGLMQGDIFLGNVVSEFFIALRSKSSALSPELMTAARYLLKTYKGSRSNMSYFNPMDTFEELLNYYEKYKRRDEEGGPFSDASMILTK